MFRMSDWDKQQWQAEQAARDAQLEKQREREAKARERSARNAARKLERLHRTLKENGEITDFEDEFADSVSERLEKFGAAFANPELGRPGDALSAAQKKVVAGMNRKVKDARKAAKAERLGKTQDDDRPRSNSTFRNKGGFKQSSFKSKSKYTPRIRQLDEEWEDENTPPEPVTKLPAPGSIREQALRAVKTPEDAPEPKPEPFIPRYTPDTPPERPPVGKPFLRIVKNDD